MARRFSSGFLWVVFAAASLSLFVYLNNDIFIDWADEGFLWYGASHLLRGQFPIRDFQAYDPGRYFWCAAVFALRGTGLMAMRFAAGLFQFFGLCFGLLALRRVLKHSWQILAAGFLAVTWMLIPCRYFDASLTLFALFFSVRLVEDPSPRRHLAAGIFTALAAFMGINHGLYLFSALLALMVYLGSGKKIMHFVRGLAVGALPFWILFLAVPGFFGSYLERLGVLAYARAEGKANVSLGIPWPWTVHWDPSHIFPSFAAKALDFTNRFSIGAMFVFVILYTLVALVVLSRMKRSGDPAKALFTASVFLGFFYLGHIFTRSDVNYMGEGIFPVLAGLIALSALAPAGLWRRLAIGALVIFSAGSLASAGLVNTPAFKNFVPKSGMTWYSVGKDRIWLLRSDAKYVQNMKKLVSQYVGPDEPILLAPLLTTFYCILEKESPVYELYFHLAPPPAQERKDIERLEKKRVRWAIVGNILIEGHPEQSFSSSHPLLWGYLTTHFEAVTAEGLRPGYILMKHKS